MAEAFLMLYLREFLQFFQSHAQQHPARRLPHENMLVFPAPQLLAFYPAGFRSCEQVCRSAADLLLWQYLSDCGEPWVSEQTPLRY